MTTEGGASQQIFDLWKRQLDEGTQAWARMLSQATAVPLSDIGGFWWKPMFELGIEQWARLFAQMPVPPELVTQWKQFLDQSIEAWSRALGEAMSTEGFAQMMGRSLDVMLTAQGPVRKVAEQSVETTLQALNLPTRSQVAGVAKQIMELEDRIEQLEDMLAAALRRLEPAPGGSRA